MSERKVAITSPLTPEEVATLQELIRRRGVIVQVVPLESTAPVEIKARPEKDDSSGPPCWNCGAVMSRSGTCHRCLNCGEQDGCG